MNNPTAQTLTVTNTVDGFADVGSTPLPIEYILDYLMKMVLQIFLIYLLIYLRIMVLMKA